MFDFSKIKTTFVALSLAGALAPLVGVAQQGSIDNKSDANKSVTIGTATTSETLKGHITTTGSGHHTSVVFRGSSKMEDGYLYADINSTKGNGKETSNGANGTSNTITLQESSFLNLKAGKVTITNANGDKKEQKTTVSVDNTSSSSSATAAAGAEAAAQTPSSIDFSILAVGKGAANNVNDLTTSATSATQESKGKIEGSIIAVNGGKNSISNLRNTEIGKSLIAQDKGINSLSIDTGSNLKGYLSATSGGSNTLTINQTAKLEMNGEKENTENASVFADGENSSNTINGTGTQKNTISGAVFAKDKAKNTITLNNAEIKGNIKAQDEGHNEVTLESGSTTSIITQGDRASNTITLQKDAKIQGYITNNETTSGAEATQASGSTNSIIVNGNSSLELSAKAKNGDNKEETNANNAALSSSGKGNKNTITGNTTAENKIANNISATKGGNNSITLQKLAIGNGTTGNNGGSIIADGEGSKNTLNLDTLKLTGNIEAKNSGKNDITAKTLTMTGGIKADSKGQNTLKIGNTTTQSTIKGDITATGSTTTAAMKKEEEKKEESSEPKDSANTLDLLNVKIEGTISATKSGENIISLDKSEVSKNITATDQGKNTITIGSAGGESKITGNIEANANGSNTIQFTHGSVTTIKANGDQAKNTITLGSTTFIGKNKANIVAEAKGENTITIQSVDFEGNITANKEGKNTITDQFPIAQPSQIQGNIIANESGTNTITLQNISITEGIKANGSGAKNTITLGSSSNAKTGVVTSKIEASNQGENTITLDSHTSLTGNIKANKGGTNTISEKESKTQSFLITGQVLADGGTNTINLANSSISNGILAQNSGKNTITVTTKNVDEKLQSNITADSGGSNVITIGEDSKTQPKMENMAGNLEGNILAKGKSSANEITLQGTGTLKGNLWSNTTKGDTTKEDATTQGMQNTASMEQGNHNTITLKDNSAIDLRGLEEDEIENGDLKNDNPYAIYALGSGARNTIKDETEGKKQFTLTGGITADNNTKEEELKKITSADKSIATNEIMIKNIRIDGDITAYNAGQNTITFTNATIQGGILAEKKGKNTITSSENSKVEVHGSVTAEKAGVNIITLEEKANFSVIADNNDKAFQATGEGAKNTFTEKDNISTSSGTIKGNIFAKQGGSNTIKVRQITIDGDAIAYGGDNAITIGGTKMDNGKSSNIPATMQGSLIADGSYNNGNVNDSNNTVILNGDASLSRGYIAALGSSAQNKSENTLTLNDTSHIDLQGKQITDDKGANIGSGNDAVIAITQKAYNKIEDKTSDGMQQQKISGNIYAKDNSINDTSIKSGNEIMLKNALITGDVIADERGQNTITLGNATKNVTETQQQAKQNHFTGNITAKETGKNTLNLHDTTLNDSTRTYGITALAQKQTTLETSNTITLDGKSMVKNTYLSAIQEATKDENVKEVKNMLELKDTTSLALLGDEENSRAIYTSGYHTSNTIKDTSTGDKSILGHIVANDMGENTLTLKNFSINQGDTIYGIQATGKDTSLEKTTNTITLEESKIQSTYLSATQESNTDTVAETSNTLTLEKSSMQLSANQDGNAIFAQGLKTKNTIKEKIPTTEEAKMQEMQKYADKITGNITANQSGVNEVTLDNLTMQGNIVANHAGSNTLTLSNSSLNASGITQGIMASGSQEDTKETKNTITLDKKSSLNHTFMSAFQKATTDTKDEKGEWKTKAVSNSLTLKDETTLHLVAGADIDGNGDLITDTQSKTAVLAYGVWAKNTITDNTTSKHQINGDIKAIFNASNQVTLNQVTMQGDIIAESAADNTIIFGKESMQKENGGNGKNGSFTGNIIALTKFSPSKNTVTFTNMEVGGANTTKISTIGGGDNAITLKEGTTLKNMYLFAQEKASHNTITLADDNSLIQLQANPESGIALFAAQGTAKNEIKATANNNEKDHTIKGIIQAQEKGTNTITLNKLTLVGNMIANDGANTLTITNSGSVTGDIQATQGGSNTSTLKDTTISGAQILAQDKGSKNAVTMSGNSSLSLQNTGKNAVFANEEGINDIKQETTNKTNFITGDIFATQKGSNTINLDNLTMKGNVIVSDSGSNTLTFGKEAKEQQMTQDQNTLEGDILSTGGKNTLTTTKAKIKGGVSASANATDNLKAENQITLKSSSLEDSYLIAKTEGEEGTFESRNTVNLYGNSKVIFKDKNGSAVLASGKNAGNLINDLSDGTQTSTITGAILAQDKGTNNLTLKNVNVVGDIKASNAGKNTLNFGQNKTTPPPTKNDKNTLKGNLIADAGENSVTLSHFAMQGSMLALSDDSKNTLSLKNESTLRGFIEAISEEKSATNTLTIEDTSTIALKGESLKDKNQQAVGTGNDAIYTQGVGAKNIIQDNTTNGAFNTIDGNVTAVSGGKNEYTFKKMQMTGSMHALKEDASNTMSIADGSYMQNGVIQAKGKNVSNTITLKDSARLNNVYLEAIAEGGSASNTITLEKDSSITLVNSGSAVKAVGDQAKNTISGTTMSPNEIKGSIDAMDSGSNQINLTKLAIDSSVNASNKGSNTIQIYSGGIGGDIIANTAGTNTISTPDITIKDDKKTNKALGIGAKLISADGKGSKNTFTLGGASEIKGGVLSATNGGENKFNLTGTSSFAFQGEKYAILADGKDSLNHVRSVGNSSLNGNIIAKDGGVNDLLEAGSMSISNAYISAIGEGSKNKIETSILVGRIVLQANTDKNAMLADMGENTLTVGNVNSKAGINMIVGNITAQNAGSNSVTYIGNDALEIKGNIIADGEKSKNTITLNSPKVPPLSQMHHTSKITTGYLSANQGGVNVIVLDDDSTFDFVPNGGNFAILASGKSAKNDLSAKEGDTSIKGNILAKDSGINDLDKIEKLSISNAYISAIGDKAANTITPTTLDLELITNPNDKNAILADGGVNTLSFSSTKAAKIMGNITAKNVDGKNTITYEGIKSSKNGENNEGLTISGSIAATTQAKNEITLKGGSKIEQGMLDATHGGTNTITLEGEKANFSFTGTGFALQADGEKSNNTITSTAHSSINGNILATNGGENNLSKVADLEIKNGYITASGEGSKNTITPMTKSKITLQANGENHHAIFASDGGGNMITLNGTAMNEKQNGEHHTITGNITAESGGKNTYTSKMATEMSGSIIADGIDSTNALTLNGASTISGGFLHASGGINTITLSDQSSFNFSGNGKEAILADGGGSKNTITAPMTNGGKEDSAKTNQITGNIIATNGGENDLSKVASLSVSQASISANGGGAKNTITTTSTNSKLELIAVDGSAILAHQGNNTITLGGGIHTITGNITATDGQNTLSFTSTNGDKITIKGDINASGTQASNQLTLGGASSVAGNLSTNQGKNTLTLNNHATFDLHTIQANGGSNTLVNSDSMMTNGDPSSTTNKISTKITATNGGSNDLSKIKNYEIKDAYLFALGNQASNTIASNEEKNKITLIANTDKNAILADHGKNILNLTKGTHTIKGNITAKEGSNTINVGAIDTTPTGNNDPKITITGGFSADGSSTSNDVKINAKEGSKIQNSFLHTSHGGKNNITLLGGATFTLENQGFAILADSGSNTISNENGATKMKENHTNMIKGNIIAKNGGENQLDKITKIEISDGYLVASSGNAKNTILLHDKSKIDLIANIDKNAILASAGENSITAASSTMQGSDNNNNTEQKITGNITADHSGKNSITLKKLILKGDIIANTQGNNTLTLSDSSSMLDGAVIASGGGVNTIEFKGKAGLQNNSGDGYAIYATGSQSKNSIKDTNGTSENGNKMHTISGNIAALSNAINTITLHHTTFEGNITAANGGKNNITLEKGTSTKIQEINALGAGADNTLTYSTYQAKGFALNASGGGVNTIIIGLNGGENKQSSQESFSLMTSTDANSKNIIVVQGLSNGASTKMYYTGGQTDIILSKSMQTGQVTQADMSKGLNPSGFSNGVMLSLDSNRANNILQDFRDHTSFTTNLTSITMKDEKNYVVSGAYIGSINTLAENTIARRARRAVTESQTTFTIDKHSSLNATFAKNTKNYAINLEESSKWFVDKSITLAQLSASNTKVDENNSGSTLLQENSIIDMVSGGYHSKRGFGKSDENLVTLTIQEAGNLDGVIFRGFAKLNEKKADKIDIMKTKDNGDNQQTTAAKLQTYYDATSLENASQYSFRTDNRSNNILVATVEKEAKNKFAFDIHDKSVVEQGYLLVETRYHKVTESKDPKPNEEKEEKKEEEGEKVDNYYILGVDARINPKESERTSSLLASTYLVYLSYVDSLNKRMGELREGVYNNNLWARSFIGQSSSNQFDIKNTYINLQLGYDYGFGSDESMHYIGVSFGYGYNKLRSSLYRANAHVIDAGLYYAYIADTGFYSDTTLKYNLISTTPQFSDLQNGIMAHALSLGEEFGYRVHFDEKRRFYLDTNANMVVGALTKINLLQKSGDRVESQLQSESGLSILLRGVVGTTLGYALRTSRNQTDFRIGVSYVADYNLGKINLNVGNIADNMYKFNYNQMVLASFGINSVLTENLKLYFEGQVGFLGKVVNQDYLVNIGVRYSFGTQKRDYPSYATMQNKITKDGGNSDDDDDEDDEDEDE